MQIGELVRLRSGGPEMTVMAARPTGRVDLVYFDGGAVRTVHDLPESTLAAVVVPEAKRDGFEVELARLLWMACEQLTVACPDMAKSFIRSARNYIKRIGLVPRPPVRAN